MLNVLCRLSIMLYYVHTNIYNEEKVSHLIDWFSHHFPMFFITIFKTKDLQSNKQDIINFKQFTLQNKILHTRIF